MTLEDDMATIGPGVVEAWNGGEEPKNIDPLTPQEPQPSCTNCYDKNCGYACDVPCSDWKYEGEEMTRARETAVKKQIDDINFMLHHEKQESQQTKCNRCVNGPCDGNFAKDCSQNPIRAIKGDRTNIIAWVVKNPKGAILINTFASTEAAAMRKFCRQFLMYATFEDAKKDGYGCVKVRIAEEVK